MESLLIRSPQEIEDFLRRKKSELDAPHVYLGKEPNSIHRDWDKAKLKILFASSWDYASFRGNQTLPLLYRMISDWREDVIIERSHVPQSEKDYKLFRKYGIPLFSVESKRSAGEFDIIMTSISYPSPWVNFPLLLRMSGIPVYGRDRDEKQGRSYPIIMVGGSACFGNFSFAYPVVDIVYVGEAEQEEDGGLIPLLETIKESNEHGLTRFEILEVAQRNHDYIFVPMFYKPTYDGPVFKGWNSSSGVPSKIRRRICKDLGKAKPLTKTLPSYTDATMGLGEVEISRGCRGTCAFCGLGWKYRPYRERSRKEAVEALKENKKNSGAVALCPIAAEFAFYGEKKTLIKDLCVVSRYVDPLSMRIDAFIDDSQFDSVLGKSGMNQCAWGVEGISQRLRNRLMKNITADDIKKACWTAVESGGFKRLKFFMINNIGETSEDYEEFYTLLKSIMNGFDKAKRKGLSLMVSWTPLVVEPCTPLQWMKPTIDTQQPWKEVVKKVNDLGVKTNMDKGPILKNDWSMLYLGQGLQLGDTRFAEAVVEAILEVDRPFYYSCPRKFRDIIAKHFRDGMTWEWIIRKRGIDEIFPWDIIDRGVLKNTLLSLYLKIESGSMDNVVTPLKPKMEECNLEDVKWSNEQDSHYWYVVRYRVDDDFDTVPNSHWKAQLHRAAYLTDFPISVNQQHFFTDRESRNWYGGEEYIGISTHEPVCAEDFEKLNSELIGFKVVGFIELPDRQFSWSKFTSQYEVVLGIPYEQVVKALEEVKTASEFIVKVPADKYSASRKIRKVNLMDCEFGTKLEDVGSATKMNLTLSNVMPVRLLVKALFPHISSQRIYKFPIKKVGLIYQTKQGYEVLHWNLVGQ